MSAQPAQHTQVGNAVSPQRDTSNAATPHDRDGRCDHCDKRATGGAVGGGQPTERWCTDHDPTNDADYAWPNVDQTPPARHDNAALITRLRSLADHIERLDAEKPLAPMDVSGWVIAIAYDSGMGDVDDAWRIDSVTRLNTALGFTKHHFRPSTTGHAYEPVRANGHDDWYALTYLTPDAQAVQA